MFHVCVQRFDGMDEKFLDGELNRALVSVCMRRGQSWGGRGAPLHAHNLLHVNQVVNWLIHLQYCFASRFGAC